MATGRWSQQLVLEPPVLADVTTVVLGVGAVAMACWSIVFLVASTALFRRREL